MTDKQNYFTYIDNTSDDTDKTMKNLYKQTIIDGVDVSGCECYSEHREGYCGWHTPCEGDICPYKLKWALQQHKHKEQECERLKLQLAHSCHDVLYKNSLQGQLDQLKAENQVLKDEFEILQNNFDSNNREWEEHTEQYIQALKEIKEFLKSKCNACFAINKPRCICPFKTILNKISEVIDENP